MKKLVLKNSFSPGDIVLLTAAVRDLHQCYPNQFETDVRTPCPELWENNRYITPLDENALDVQVIDCSYPMVNRSNHAPYHVIHGFIEFLNQRLDLNIKPTTFKGDIHLSAFEMEWDSQVQEQTMENMPFWIIVAGGKDDVTIKWWDVKRYQKVVDYFKGKIQFVQVGAKDHFHPSLEGVIDMRGQTDLRQLVRLVYHAQGVLCPVTLLMHLAASVEVKGGLPRNRPCVVVAGGREPVHWEAYPHHQFIHTGGSLLCCDNGGCWKSRTLPLGDGSERDQAENLCVDVVGKLPRCMDMITSAEVIRRIESYFEGGAVQYLTPAHVRAADRAISAGEKRKWNKEALEMLVFKVAGNRFIKNLAPYSGSFQARGIVICGGGARYFTNAWVCINMLRQLGCSLPIQFWYLGRQELDERMEALIKPLGVECVDALKLREKHPARILNGYELKPYSILHCPFKEVLLLDADNVAIVNPEFLFETPQFKETGAIFWPDYGRLGRTRTIWKICAVAYRDEPEFESGQIVIDKERCWRPLCLAMWYNEHSDYFYHHIHGDKDTFHMAFRRLEYPYSMPKTPIHTLPGTMCQHDFDGRRIFQHRNLAKWCLHGKNRRIPDFGLEDQCLEYLRILRNQWDGHIRRQDDPQTQATENLEHVIAPQNNVAQRRQERSFRRSGKRIVFRCPANSYTGYGLHSCQIISDLERIGYTFKVRPTEVDEKFARIPGRIKRKFVNHAQPDEWELMLHPPNIPPTPGKRTVFFTMWEASRLPKEWVNWLNQAECVVVPCQWNATSFSASGVNKPIRIIPLGIKTDIFSFRELDSDGPCIFGTAGKMYGGGERKGLNEVAELFQKAFPTEKDVRLRVKGFPDCGILSSQDSRIEITASYLPEKQMADWYASLTCFVSVSRSEGWGLMPHQAMAVGRPCIAAKFGGHAEFLNETVGYCVDFKLAPAGYNYAGCGVWAEPDEDHVIELMRHVYDNRNEAKMLGEKASSFASKMTWNRSNRALLEILREVGMVL